MLKTLIKYFPLLIILITLSEVFNKLLPGKFPQVYNYIVYILFGFTCLLYYLRYFKRIHNENKIISWIYIYIIVYIILGGIKQFFIPSGIFPFFRLSISMALLSIGAIFIFRYENRIIAKTFHLWWKIIPFIFICTFWVLEPSQYIKILSFCLFYLFLLPFLRIKRKLIVIMGILFIIINGMEQRIDFINIILCFILLFIIKYIKNIPKVFFLLNFRILMFIPILFVITFYITGFNILKLDQFIDNEVQLAGQLNADTRSFLYEEAWLSGINNNNLVVGRTPFYGYDSNFAENREGDSLLVKGQKSQRISEVFIVNLLTWFGLIGIIFFFILYYKIGTNTLKKSQNPFLFVFSIYIAFFWIESWIGNILFTPNSSYILLCIVIAICIDPRFQKMNFKEIRIYINKILNS